MVVAAFVSNAGGWYGGAWYERLYNKGDAMKSVRDSGHYKPRSDHVCAECRYKIRYSNSAIWTAFNAAPLSS